MRARLGGLVAAAILLGASLGLPIALPLRDVIGPEPAAASSFVPDGRIAWAESFSGEPGLRTGKRTCQNLDCDERRITTGESDEEPAWSPTGRQIAFSRQVDEQNRFIFVLDIVTGASWQVTRTQVNDEGFPIATGDRNPVWSPDATSIAFGRSTELGDQIGFVDPGGAGTVRLLPDDPDGHGNGCDRFGARYQRSDPSFSNDGRISYDVNTVFVPLSSVPVAPIQLAAATLPDGLLTRLAAGEDCDHKGVWISRTDSHVGETQVAPQLGQAWASAWSPDGKSIAMETNDATYVVPLGGGTPIVIRDSLGNAPHGSAASGFLGNVRDGRVGWDPAGTFLLIEAPGLSSDITVKYKPDGSGDLDIPAGTSASHGVAVQCLPEQCLTSFTIIRYTSGPGGQYPATFDYSGTVSGRIVLPEELFGATGSLSGRVTPGRLTVTETTSSTWGLGAIACTTPATIDLPSRTVSVDVALGESVTCIFSTDLNPPLPSGVEVTPPVASTACTPPANRHLGVPLVGQETDKWCWAASTQMVLAFFGRSVSQGQIANDEFGRTDCLDTPVPVACIDGGFPRMDRYGFVVSQTPDRTALSWAELTKQIGCLAKPVAFTWHWIAGGGHAMVAAGYRTQGAVQYVEVDDPWPPGQGDTYLVPYASWVSSPHVPAHDHWFDYFDVTFFGP